MSITIKKPTSDYSNNPEDDKNVQLDIEANHDAVKDALKKFVEAYNDVVSSTRTATSSDGTIGNDAGLNSALSSIRSLTSSVSNNTGAFKLLSDIGISTSKDDALNLKIDEEKLDKALNENFESVKKLLSDGYTNNEDGGLFDQLVGKVNDILDMFLGKNVEIYRIETKGKQKKIYTEL